MNTSTAKTSPVQKAPGLWRRSLRLTLRWVRRLAYTTALLFIVFLVLDRLFPVPLNDDRGFSALVVASNGEPLRAFPDKNGIWRYPVTLQQVSPHYFDALLGYEDRWFYRHPGINPVALLRALKQRLLSGRIVSGGSTLTMQVARILDPHTRTVSGKLKQIFRALQLEWHYTKREILTLYINRAPYGGTIEGVEAASRAYLGKSARELTRAEAALLAVLPQSPSRLRPDRHPRRAQAARDKVIDRMVRFGIWTRPQGRQAKIEQVVRRRHQQPMLAPLFARRLKAKALRYGVLRTTLDYALQLSLEDRVRDYLARFPEQTSAAILVVENKTLAVRAYIGSADFGNPARFGHVDMVRAIRSPGSTLKPFLYGLAIEDGLLHSESLLTDAPVDYNGYRPANFSSSFRGPVSLSRALQLSLNLPAVQTLYHYTPAKFMARVRNGGLRLVLPPDTRPNLSVILGGAGTSLESLVSAYTAFGRNGLSGRLRFTAQDPISERRMLDPGAAWVIRRILQEHRRPGVAQDLFRWSGSRRVAWKTGTSYGYRDAWAIGVTDQYTIGVWIGRPDGTPIPGHYGAVTAAPVLFDVVDSLPTREQVATTTKKPANVSTALICWPLGLAYQPERKSLCHQRRRAWIVNDIIPPTLPDIGLKTWESRVVKYWINSRTGLLVDARCNAPQREARLLARWPYALQPWLPRTILKKTRTPPTDKSCPYPLGRTHGDLKITGLASRTVIRRPGPNAPQPSVQLAALGGQKRLYWLINGRLALTSGVNKSFSYKFKNPGLYKITVMDAKGHYDSVEIKIIK